MARSALGLRALYHRAQAAARGVGQRLGRGLWPWGLPPWRVIWGTVLAIVVGPWVIWGLIRYGLYVQDFVMGRRAP